MSTFSRSTCWRSWSRRSVSSDSPWISSPPAPPPTTRVAQLESGSARFAPSVRRGDGRLAEGDERVAGQVPLELGERARVRLHTEHPGVGEAAAEPERRLAHVRAEVHDRGRVAALGGGVLAPREDLLQREQLAAVA